MSLVKIISACLLLGACTQQQSEMQAPDAAPVSPVTTTVRSSFYDCTVHVLELEKMIGKKPPQTSYFPVRILAPGSAATTDHNLARLNIYVDTAGNILSANCG